MDDEIKQNLIKYEAIKQKVFVAFDGFILGDVIGFWEADARDGYLLQTIQLYLGRKQKFDKDLGRRNLFLCKYFNWKRV